MTASTAAKSIPRPQTKATRRDWIQIALETLIEQGIEQVKVLSLANKLDVSRASFYWYFNNRKELQDELIHHWTVTNTHAILDQANKSTPSIVEAVANIFSCWMDEKRYDPRLDGAIRAWAHQDKHIHQIVDADDEKRLSAIRAVFEAHGFDKDEAFIRARVLYFMQIGYYALNIKEPFEKRLSYFELYVFTFTGVRPSKLQIHNSRKIIRESLKKSSIK